MSPGAMAALWHISENLYRSLPGNAWQTLVLTDLVDDLQHALTEGGILYLKLLEQTAVVHQIVAGPLFSPGLVLERNARVGEKLPDHVGQLPQAERRATRVIDEIAGRIGQQDPHKDLGNIVDMDGQPHVVPVGQRD